VRLSVDANTFLIGSNPLYPAPLFLNPHQPLDAISRSPYRETYSALREFSEKGGRFTVTNIPQRRFLLPQSGRSHIKGAVVNNTVYFGGCNLDRPQYVDLMVRWQSGTAADALFKLVAGLVDTANARTYLKDTDQRTKLAPGMTMLVDAGVPNQSVILSEAIKLIDNADDWLYMTSQYFPGGQTGEALARAVRERNVKVELYFSDPTAHEIEAPIHEAYIAFQRLRLPAELFAGRLPKDVPKLHPKVLASEKAAMWGSHNFVGQGVKLGTAEVCILYDNPTFAANLRDEMKRIISRYTAA
jgi:phosphatidylserine/phosphatidylglycerophosphate/cardiolipin synthase-like enzyme